MIIPNNQISINELDTFSGVRYLFKQSSISVIKVEPPNSILNIFSLNLNLTGNEVLIFSKPTWATNPLFIILSPKDINYNNTFNAFIRDLRAGNLNNKILSAIQEEAKNLKKCKFCSIVFAPRLNPIDDEFCSQHCKDEANKMKKLIGK